MIITTLILLLLENIRDNAKINSEIMNQKLENIEEYSADTSNDVKYSREDTKKHRKDNTAPSWEF